MRRISADAQQGFTIVELLLLIVVIGILAAVSIVASISIQNRAADAAVQSDLHNLGTKVMAYETINGNYPYSDAPYSGFPGDITFAVNKSAYDTSAVNLLYCVSKNTNNRYKNLFAISAVSKSGKIFTFSGGSVRPFTRAWTYTTQICRNSGVYTDSTLRIYSGYYRNWSSWTNG